MVRVGPASVIDDAHLIAFVEKLAESGDATVTKAACAQIRQAIESGATPAGLRRLAEEIADSVGDASPRARPHTAADASLAAAVQANTLVVLDGFAPHGVAAAVADLLADGCRVVVTATDPDELVALRAALPVEVRDRCLDDLPALSPAEQRELRRLLATATASRQARRGEELPAPARLPGLDEIAELCRRAERGRTGTAIDLLPGLLAGLEPDRRAAVTEVARAAVRALRALGPRTEQAWTWRLLSDLVHSRHRPMFERLVEDVAQAVAAERAGTGPPITVIGPLPADSAALLRRYLAFLLAGGRPRTYFRSPEQRDVQPVLRQFLVDDVVPETVEQVRRALEHVELAERLRMIDASCREVGIPVPRNPDELAELAEGLTRVAAAARSVGALRHDVLFIHPNSPIPVPDVIVAEQIAADVVDYAEHGFPEQAARQLDRYADQLTGLAPAPAIAAEHTQAVEALRARDAAGYGAALDALAAARREQRDEQRCTELLGRLRVATPKLADLWESGSRSGRGGFGLVSFVAADRLLERLPEPDAADVVILLGAAEHGVDRLLLTAVAPRLVAAVGPGARSSRGPSLLSVLYRANALVVPADESDLSTTGQVLRLPTGGDSRPRKGDRRVRREGA
ncbi:hypothetical protein [Pseudonocardia asaccharolytica]|uniref:Uncharacterized protein n=1 Tax=Pseudonocardia asaccharolytica DSM 44247 = NBRC 16224 TaxID=1123024 RepID=A0A511D7N5_9PSEU|nr:hypothetical protein [Pseudonocardia asaccharolytica]GEL19644.1 hypothetical protein PA7_34810 [Pseudonocardia asaccharolytica DSM 44247 = NBRC 16224]